MTGKADRYYYDNILAAAQCCCDAAGCIEQHLSHYDRQRSEQVMKELHRLGRSAQSRHREIKDALAKSFITPLEREDIVALSRALCDVVQAAVQVAESLYLAEACRISPAAAELACNISGCCRAIKELAAALPHRRKSPRLREHWKSLARLEEQGERLYLRGRAQACRQVSQPPETAARREIFDRLRDCVRVCARAGECFEIAVMKNS